MWLRFFATLAAGISTLVYIGLLTYAVSTGAYHSRMTTIKEDPWKLMLVADAEAYGFNLIRITNMTVD